MRAAAAILAAVALAAGCGSDTDSAADEPATEATTTEAPTTEPAEESRCEDVLKALIAAIEEGLTVHGRGTLRSAQAVKSTDFKNVYYVSADVQGAGLEGPDDVATWATNSLTAGDGLILAADAVAKEFSTWGADVNPDSPLGETMSLQNDGAEESRDCATNSD